MHIQETNRAGLPTTRAKSGTSLVTTAPAPIIAHFPMQRPGKTVALAPMEAPVLTRVIRYSFGYRLLRGRMSFVKAAHGPTKTSLSRVMPSQR